MGSRLSRPAQNIYIHQTQKQRIGSRNVFLWARLSYGLAGSWKPLRSQRAFLNILHINLLNKLKNFTNGLHPWKAIFSSSTKATFHLLDLMPLQSIEVRGFISGVRGESVFYDISYHCSNCSSKVRSWSYTRQSRRLQSQQNVLFLNYYQTRPKQEFFQKYRTFQLLDFVRCSINWWLCWYHHWIEPNMWWLVVGRGREKLS